MRPGLLWEYAFDCGSNTESRRTTEHRAYSLRPQRYGLSTALAISERKALISYLAEDMGPGLLWEYASDCGSNTESDGQQSTGRIACAPSVRVKHCARDQ
ncbi:hypothetical protein [Fontibacillus phaseoli]|uniref:hypothetical protein n=1 Tax=Fontibacillus phaseoli TaxID=1416533 RepID=UPI000DF1CE02|nr:hypothetical protein [Fontibacillus phaseoli]